MFNTAPQLFFAYFSAVILILSVVVITRKNPVHSVIWMLFLFFHIAGLYLFLNAEFIAAIQIIIYAGAILVLFLFVVFLLNLRQEIRGKSYIKLWPITLIFSSSIFVIMLTVLRSFELAPSGQYTIELIKKETHTKILGQLLYSEFLFPFEIASLILLVAIVGAVVLAKK
ncbi:MAG: NADH-quinone oxidoreductase subunit J [Nitrospiraceae bacterium]|nr:NADH-quinone oxidoreductase subunit J [Nitrospiraceae bacterium]